MDNGSPQSIETDMEPGDIVRQRKCLKCRTPFRSDWAGERVCAPCKSKADWRQGAAMRPHPASNRR
jgi:hypothetical protein